MWWQAVTSSRYMAGKLISRGVVSCDRYGLGGYVRRVMSQFSPADVGRKKKEAAPWRNAHAGWLGWSDKWQPEVM
jgi:hypothetical protein